MKNQYFGDDRDVFKYDFALAVLRGTPLNRFTFVPMLTPPDDSGHGDVDKRSSSAPGMHNKQLVDYLNSCRTNGRRDIAEIKPYFEDAGISIHIHKAGYYLKHTERSSYFEGLDASALESSLVFVDPDNGLEIQDSSEKHLLLNELKDLYMSIGDDSVLMFFQYRPRMKKRADLVLETAARLYDIGLGPPMVVAESSVSFFLLVKNSALRDEVASIITGYLEQYRQLRIWNV